MNKLVSVCAALSLSVLLGSTAFASDKKAIELYQEAVKHWRTDANKCESLLQKALAETQPKPKDMNSKAIRANVLLAMGQFYQGKTGDFDNAIKHYRMVLLENVGVNHPKVTNMKAQALLNLGTIYYSVKKDIDEAVVKFKDAHKTYPTAQTADTLSQILFRQARGANITAPSKKKKLETALALAREAIMIDKKNPNKRSTPALRAKYRLQLVICLEALDQKDEAASEWKSVDQGKLGDTALYQLAQLEALRAAKAGEGKGSKAAEKIAALLRKAISEKLRPAARARNQLRWFIRTEADFAPFVKDESWQDLTKDEPEKG
ncbi:MAG TPA: hypothetical protein DEA08_29885 [Planctomycetes bacterium]|nr:hypothetical protein [Planctomycetota bacterium]